MAKKKKKFGLFSKGKKLTKAEKKQRSKAWLLTAGIFVAIILCVSIVVGFIFLERFALPKPETVDIELVNYPAWAGGELKEKIIETAIGDYGKFDISKNTTMLIGENLSSSSWLGNVKVNLSNKAIIITADYRKPLGLLQSADRKYYITSDMTILDYVPMSKLTVVDILGVPAHLLSWRSVGTKWNSEDITAAVELLSLLAKMDTQVTAEKPLLGELKSIDVSNFNGRRSSSQPHIVFYATDGTEIRWGAAKGQWHKYLEARDEEKLTVLYNTYQQFGTVRLKSANRGSFIDLTQPQNLSLPIDRY